MSHVGINKITSLKELIYEKFNNVDMPNSHIANTAGI